MPVSALKGKKMTNRQIVGILMLAAVVFLLFVYFVFPLFFGFGFGITNLIRGLGAAFFGELGVGELPALFAALAVNVVCIAVLVALAVYGKKFIACKNVKENKNAE